MRRWRSSVRNREALAIRADIDILALLCDAPPPNEIRGELGIVFVRGPIDHHASFGDSYERFTAAFHELNDDASVKAIVMIVDSPGGLVSGLNSTVRALRKAKVKPVYAIADEMATSAAYALSCIADEIIATPSAVVGSVGVISTMCSQARADQRQGLDFVTITSGERKADGHPHMPIEEGAIRAEEERVDELAAQFYALVRESRDLEPEYLRALEAGIFLGADALEMGLVDDVADVDEAIEAICARHALAQLDTTAAPDSGVVSPEASMLTAKAKIAALTRKMAASTSKKERSSLASQVTKLLAALPSAATTKKSYRLEEEKTETSDEDEEEEGGNETDREEEGDEDKKEASHSEEEESAESDDYEKKAEFPDKKDDDDKDKKKEKSAAARGELAALRAEVTSLRSVVATITTQDAKAKHATVLAEALRTKRITPAEAKSLAKEDGAYVKAFLAARPKSIVLTPEEALRPLPKGSAEVAKAEGGHAEAVDLTPEMQAMLEGIADEKVRAQVLANWKAQVNGVAR